MPLYLWEASYTADGTKGLLKEGGTNAVRQCSRRWRRRAGSCSLSISPSVELTCTASQNSPIILQPRRSAWRSTPPVTATLRTTALLTPEEMDAAAKKTVSYRPPGA